MAASARPTLPPVPALLLSMVSLQGGAAFAKTLFPEAGAYGTAALRATLAALLLALVFRPNLRALSREDWRAIVPYGLSLGFMNLVFYASVQHLPLGLAVTVEFVGPLLLSLYLSREPLDYLWVGLAGLGIVLIAPHSAGSGVSWLGVGLALLAGAFWALYIVTGSKVAQRVPGSTSVVAGMIVAAVIALPVGMWSGGSQLLSPPLLLSGLAVALLSSAIPYTLEMQALRALPARVFGVLMSMEPAVAALSGLVILHERLTVLQWVALACVVAASAGISLTSRGGGLHGE